MGRCSTLALSWEQTLNPLLQCRKDHVTVAVQVNDEMSSPKTRENSFVLQHHMPLLSTEFVPHGRSKHLQIWCKPTGATRLNVTSETSSCTKLHTVAGECQACAYLNEAGGLWAKESGPGHRESVCGQWKGGESIQQSMGRWWLTAHG